MADVRLVMVVFGYFRVNCCSFSLQCYRTARGVEVSIPICVTLVKRLAYQTHEFLQVVLPTCQKGILAGTVLSFARGAGGIRCDKHVSGFTPGQTATISTTVYQLWRTGDDAKAYLWVMVNITISFIVLLAINSLEARQKKSQILQSSGV